MTKEEIVQGLYRGDSKAIKEAIKALDSDYFARKDAELQLARLYDHLKELKEQQPIDDCVSRQAVLDILSHYAHNFGADNEIKSLPPVKPTHGTCKDCKHWKDSDGVYRRGIDAESKCPINIKEVYEGNFYCKWFEKRGSENE